MVTPAKGFGELSVGDVLVGQVPLAELLPVANPDGTPPGEHVDLTAAVTDIIVERTIDGASSVTLQLLDTERTILRSGLFQNGIDLTLDGLNFAMVQTEKTGDQLQVVFEAAAAYDLRKQSGAFNYKSATDLDGFARYLLAGGPPGPHGGPAFAVPGAQLVAQPGAVSFATGSGSTASTTTVTSVPIARGTTSLPDEDSWTCLNRLANSAGWRCFECEGDVYLGSDTWLLTQFPSGGTLEEFTDGVQDIDGTYDVGMPLGQLTVTAMTVLWPYKPGQPVTVAGMGPFDGTWLVYSMQRGLYSPQASITLQKPMTAEQVRLGLPTLQYV